MLPFDRRDIADSKLAAESALGLRARPLASEMIALEPRMVFDGAALATAVDVKQSADAAAAPQSNDASDPAAHATAKLVDALSTTAPPEPTATAPDATPREIVFIDARVSDPDAFRSKAGPNALVVMVGVEDDGLSVISQILSQQTTDVSAVHIIGHGVEGAQRLGASVIDLATIETNTDQLHAWQSHLTAEADILLYGCEVAAGEDGAALIAALAQSTGADVAASADAVGMTKTGVDWTLERTTGVVEAKTLAPEVYGATLTDYSAEPTVSNWVDDAFLFTSSTREVKRALTTTNLNENAGNDSTPGFSGKIDAADGTIIRIYDISGSTRTLFGSTVVSKTLFTLKAGDYVASDLARTGVSRIGSLPDGRRSMLITAQEAGKLESQGLVDTAKWYMNVDTAAPNFYLTTLPTRFDDTRGATTTGAYTRGMVIDDPNASFTFTVPAGSTSYRLYALGDDGTLYDSRASNLVRPFADLVKAPVAGTYTRTFRVYYGDTLGNILGVDKNTGLPDLTSNPANNGAELVVTLKLAAAPTIDGIMDNVNQFGAPTTPTLIARNTVTPPVTNDDRPTLKLSNVSPGAVSFRVFDTYTSYTETGAPTPKEIGNVTFTQLADGTWESSELDLTGKNGGHVLTVYSQDAAGLASIDATMSFSLDAATPTFTFNDATGSVRSTLSSDAFTDGVTLVGNTDKPADARIAITYTITDLLSNTAVTKTGIAKVGSNFRWSFTLPSEDLGTGFKTIEAMAQDGNLVTSPTVRLERIFVTSGWSPGGFGLQGLDTWFDASSLNNLTIKNGLVASLLDLSGHMRDAAQTDALKQPSLVLIDANAGATSKIYSISFANSFDAYPNTTVNLSTSDFLKMTSGGALDSIIFAGDISPSLDYSTVIDSRSLGPLRSATESSNPLNSDRIGFFITGGKIPASYGFIISAGSMSPSTITSQDKFNAATQDTWVTGAFTHSGSALSASVDGFALNSFTATWDPNADFHGIGGPYYGKIGLIVTYSRTLSAAEQEILANIQSERFSSPLKTGVTDRFDLTGIFAPANTVVTYTNNMGGILRLAPMAGVTPPDVSKSSNGGLSIEDRSFLSSGASIMFGDNNKSGVFARSTTTGGDNPGVTRMERQWAIDVTGGAAGGLVDISFDLASAYANIPGKTYNDFKTDIDGHTKLKLAWRAKETDTWTFIDAQGDASTALQTGLIKFNNVAVNAGAGSLQNGFITLMDGPVIKSITNDDSSSSIQNPVTARTTTFHVYVSEQLGNLVPGSFNVNVLEGAFPNRTVSNIIPRGLQSSGQYLYDVLVDVGVGAGRVSLNYNYMNPTAVDLNDAGVAASPGNNYMIKTTYQEDGVSIAFDTRPPQLTVSFSDPVLKLSSGTGPSVETTVVKFSFDEATYGFDANDIQYDQSLGMLSDFAQSATEANVWTATYTPSAGKQAKPVFTVRGGVDSYQDVYGNYAADPVTATIVVDTVRPSAAIARLNPAQEITNSDRVTFRVTFSEEVRASTVQAADFTVTGSTATIASVTAVAGNPLAYDIVVSGGDLAAMNGTIGLRLSDTYSIEDLAFAAANDTGNQLIPTLTASETYKIDNTGPKVTEVTLSDDKLKIGEKATLTIKFSEAIDPATFTLDDLSGFASAGALTNLLISADGLSATATFEPLASVRQSGAIVVGQNFTDVPGNTATLGGQASFEVDTIAPKTLSIVRSDPAAQITNSDTLKFLVTFSEAVRNVDAADFAVTNGAGTILSGYTVEASAGPDATQWFVTVSEGNLATYDGVIGLAIASKVAIDDLANGTGPGNDLPGAQPATSQSYLLDNVAPAVTFDSYDDDVAPGIGALGAGTTTNDKKPLFRGTVENGATVQILDGANELGLATIDAGAWLFEPASGLSEGLHTMTARAMDAAGNTTDATFTLTVKAINSAPVAVNDSGFKTSQGDSIEISFATLLQNDTDADSIVGDTRAFNKVGLTPVGGTVTVDYVNEKVVFKPTPSFTGQASFTYTIVDLQAAVSNAATVTITVEGVALSNDTAAVNEDATVEKTAANGVLSNDPTGFVVTGIGVSSDALSLVTSTAGTEVATDYGKLTIYADGSYAFVADGAKAQALPAGVTATQAFTYAATDARGVVAQGVLTITITGVNDAAVISGVSTGAVTENGGVGNGTVGVPTTGGTLTVTDVDAGESVFVAPTSLAGTYGAFTFNAGVWTYTLDQAKADALTAGQTATDSLTVSSKDGTTKTIVVTITGANDAATFGGVAAGAVTENGGVNNATVGIPTTGGTLTVTDVDAGESAFVTPANLAGTYGAFTFNAGVWTYTLDQAKADKLTAGQTVTDTLNVSSRDGTAKAIVVTITGANDTAVIGGVSTGTVIENSGVGNSTAGVAAARGTLTVSDVDSGESGFLTSANVVGTYGGFTFNAATGAWVYTLVQSKADVLKAGQTGTDTLIVSSLDGTTKAIAVTVTGANDAAVIGGVSTGAVTENGGVANGAVGVPTTGGTLTVTDVDAGESAFVTPANLAGTYGAFTFNAGVWTYTLDQAKADALTAGQTATDTLTVASRDGTTKTIVVTITGANDTATFGGVSTGAVTENGGVANGTAGVPTTGGTLTVTDADAGESGFQTPASLVGAYGVFTFNAGVWTYTLDQAKADALTAGQTATDTLNVSSKDGTTKTIVVTITGANDAATFGGVSTGAVTEDGGLNNATVGARTTGGTLTVSDVDAGESGFQTPANLAGIYGAFTFNAGVWTYTLDQAKADALTAGQTATDTLTVASRDGTTKTIVVTITGANDTPVIGGVTTGAVTENGGVANGAVGVPTTGGTLTVTDADAGEGVFVTPANLTGTYGAFTFNAGVWTYTLDQAKADALTAGQTATDRLNVSSRDGTTKTIVVTITGANDAATFGGVAAGAVTENGGVDNGAIGVPATGGTLTVSDVDAGESGFQAPANLAGAYGAFTFNAGVWSYTLDQAKADALKAGQTATDTLNVSSRDGTTKTIVVTITGANDAPLINPGQSSVAASLVETNVALSASGKVAFSDVDLGDVGTAAKGGARLSSTVPLTANEEAAIKAALSVQADGTWTFALPSPDYLPAGSTVILTTTVVVSDAAGASTACDVVVTITGTNDAPVAEASLRVTMNEDTILNGAMAVTDVDRDPLAYSVKPGFGPAHGSLAIDAATGRYVYVPDRDYNRSDTFTVVARDGKGGVVEQVVLVTLVPVNDAPVGDVLINGVLQIGQVLTASHTLTDVDGLGPVSYQWLRDGVEIPGAKGLEYTLAPGDVERDISVRATYVDGDGTREQVTSASVRVSMAPVPQPEPSVTTTTTETPAHVFNDSSHLKVMDVIQSSAPKTDEQSTLQSSSITIPGGQTLSSTEMLLTARTGGDAFSQQNRYNGFMFVTVERGSLIELRVLGTERFSGDVYKRLTEDQYSVVDETSSVDMIGSSVFIVRNEPKAKVVLEIKQGDGRTSRIELIVDTVRGVVELGQKSVELSEPPGRFSSLISEEVDPGVNVLLDSLAFLNAPASGGQQRFQ